MPVSIPSSSNESILDVLFKQTMLSELLKPAALQSGLSQSQVVQPFTSVPVTTTYSSIGQPHAPVAQVGLLVGEGVVGSKVGAGVGISVGGLVGKAVGHNEGGRDGN